MPITRKQFDLAVESRIEEWMKTIHAFLAEHKDEAFSTIELKQALHPIPAELEGLRSADIRRGGGQPDIGTVDWVQLEKERAYKEDDRAIDRALEKLAQLRTTEERIASGTSYYLYRRPLPSR
ncbi:MAG: hypothetical protein Q8O86_08200 [Dehalococcoidia bacterium]|nr:hypothetical protein [Dehalococcoidia bacterium]